MLFESSLLLLTSVGHASVRCDLMLFDSVFQCRVRLVCDTDGCDLMLFDSVFQFAAIRETGSAVVI